MVAQYLANGFTDGCLYAVLALGFALIYNTTRIFHMAYGAIYTTSAYICLFFLVRMHCGVVPAVIGAMAVSTVLGVLVELFVYAPLDRQRASLLVALLSSLGLYIASVNMLAMLFGNETQILLGEVDTTYHVGSVILTQTQVIQVIASLAVLGVVLISLKFTHLGRSVRAIRDDPLLTDSVGINRPLVRLLLFALSSAMAAIVAVMTALEVGIDPNIGMPAVLVAAVAVIIGGVGSYEGAVVGGMLMGLIQSLVLWQASARWTDAITFALLILFMVFRPQGLIRRRRRLEDVLA